VNARFGHTSTGTQAVGGIPTAVEGALAAGAPNDSEVGWNDEKAADAAAVAPTAAAAADEAEFCLCSSPSSSSPLEERRLCRLRVSLCASCARRTFVGETVRCARS
jgi:hypothetical protein